MGSRFNNTQRRIQLTCASSKGRQRVRHTQFCTTLVFFLPAFKCAALQRSLEVSGNVTHCGAKSRHFALDFHTHSAVTQEPAGRATNQSHQLCHHIFLNISRYLIVQRADLSPVLVQREGIPGGNIGACDINDGRAGRIPKSINKGDPHMVHHVVSQLRRNNFTTQTVAIDRICKLLIQCIWEGCRHNFCDIAI